MKEMLARATQRSRRNVNLNKGREIGMLVEGEDFECKKSDFEVNAMMNR
jgi:hypothetical protein